MDNRKEEIAFVVDMIQKMCVEAQIGLVARDRKGTLLVAIQDATNGKEYVMTKEK